MRGRVHLAAAIPVVLLCGALNAAPSAGKVHEDERWGYKVRIPGGWITAALSADEEWIASKHFEERERVAKKGLWLVEARPEMWVIGFPHARQDDRAARTDRAEEKVKLVFKNPYKDYKDFLARERWYAGGGYYFSEEEETEHAGMKVTKYEIVVDKLVDAPFRMFTWVYHFDDIDYAVQFKVLEDYVRSYKGTFQTCLKSFRRIARTGAIPGTVTTGEQKILDDVDESKLTKEERAKLRLDRVERKYRREVAILPDGWDNFRSDHFLVISNASKGYTRGLVNHAEAIRRYLDETFGTLGVDTVPPAILRVFATSAEYEAYSQGTKRFWSSAEQVLVVEGSPPESINWELTDQWLTFKNRNLEWNMPDWIRSGLTQHMSFARTKGKRVEFEFDSWDRNQLKTLVKNDEAVPIRDLILGTGSGEETDFSGEIDWEQVEKMSRRSTQAGAVVTYLLTKGNRGPFKDAVRKYLGHLIVAIEDAEAEAEEERKRLEAEAAAKAAEAPPAAARADDDEDEEDEEAEQKADEEAEKHWQQMREVMKKRDRQIREKAFQGAFGHLTDKDWKSLDAKWRRFVD